MRQGLVTPFPSFFPTLCSQTHKSLNLSHTFQWNFSWWVLNWDNTGLAQRIMSFVCKCLWNCRGEDMICWEQLGSPKFLDQMLASLCFWCTVDYVSLLLSPDTLAKAFHNLPTANGGTFIFSVISVGHRKLLVIPGPPPRLLQDVVHFTFLSFFWEFLFHSFLFGENPSFPMKDSTNILSLVKFL